MLFWHYQNPPCLHAFDQFLEKAKFKWVGSSKGSIQILRDIQGEGYTNRQKPNGLFTVKNYDSKAFGSFLKEKKLML